MNEFTTRLALSSLLLPVMAGCSLDYSGIADVLPDADRVVMEHPGEAGAEAFDSSAKTTATGGEGTAEGEPTGCQDATNHLSRRANDEVRRTLDMLHHITSHPASEVDGNVYTYLPPEPGERPDGEAGGPPPQGDDAQPPAANEGGQPGGESCDQGQGMAGPPPPPPFPHRLVVTEVDDGSYTYAFQVDADGDDTWEDHISGIVDAGSTQESGSGSFVVDFDALAGADPERARSGTATYNYGFMADGSRSVDVELDQVLDPDGTLFDSTLMFDRTADAMAKMYAWRMDELGSEVMDVARWNAEMAGRCDSQKTGGDLGTSLGEMTQCWDESRAQVYSLMSLDGDVQEERGDASQCAFSDNGQTIDK